MGDGFGLIYFNTVSIQSVLRRDGGGGWAYLKGTGLLDYLWYLITLIYFNCTVHSLIRSI